jgi:putative flippase GtrA
LISVQFLKFVFVGVSNTLFSLSVIYALKWFWSVTDVWANLSGYTLGLMLSFLLNGRWTFQFRGNWARAFGLFIAVFAVAYLSNLAVVMALIDSTSINTYLAHAVGVPLYTILMFTGSRLLVFNNSRQGTLS